MQRPDLPGGSEEQLSPEARRRVLRAAFLRPWGLLVVAIGAVSFATTLAWWIVPLTLATYAALVLLAARDPLFRSRVLEGRGSRSGARRLGQEAISPERRARWLPRGETRQKVEAALEVHRRALIAIEESGDVAKAVMHDAVPKLHRIAERLVEVAQKRERASEAIQELKVSGSLERHEGQSKADLAGLENEVRAADAEISDAFEKLLTLRARVVRISVESGGAAQDAAAKLNADLDELNLRLEALRSTLSPPEPPNR
jgi:chromosome segregation ATPase